MLVQSSGKVEASQGTYRVDAGRDPAHLDWLFEPDRPGARPSFLLGIYKMEGDTLTICLHGASAPPADRRPTEFKHGSEDQSLRMYKRVKD